MQYLLPIMVFLPVVAAVVVALAGSQQAKLVRRVSLTATLATLALSVLAVANYRPGHHEGDGPIQLQMELQRDWLTFDLPGPTFDQRNHAKVQLYFGVDGISLSLVVLTTLLMVSSVLISWESITDRVAEYYALLLVLESGMLGVFCSFDLLLFYIFFEFTLIPLFFLIGIWGGPQKRYAARKFFIYTLAGSMLGLVGLVALVLAFGDAGRGLSLSIPALAKTVAEGFALPYDLQWWIFLALFAAFAIKVPLFPFHTWLPLAHVEAPTAGSVLLAGVLLKLGTYGFLRLCLPLLPGASFHLGVPLIAVLSVIGIIYGSLCALAQEDIKKLVAYSSVAHLGFCMLGMFALNAEGVSGSVLQMVNHGLSTGALFLLVGMVYERYHTRQLRELGGLASRLPLLTTFMVFISLSSIGLPGLNGFVGEILILIGVFKFEPVYAVLAAIGIVLGAWYMLTMLQRAFFGPLKEPHRGHDHGSPISDIKPREIAALLPIAAACLWIGVYPKPFLDFIRPDVEAIVAPYQSIPTRSVSEARRGASLTLRVSVSGETE